MVKKAAGSEIMKILKFKGNGLFECIAGADSPETAVLTDRVYINESFFNELNNYSFSAQSDYANEFFLYFYLRYFEYLELIKGYDSVRSDFLPWKVDWYLFELARKRAQSHCISVTGLALIAFHVLLLPILVFFIFAMVFLLYFYSLVHCRNCLGRKDFTTKTNLYLTRTHSAYDKMRGFYDPSDYLSVMVTDDVFGFGAGYTSIYSPLRWLISPKILFQSLLVTSKDIYLVSRDIWSMLGGGGIFILLGMYSIRLAQKAIYQSCLETILAQCQKDAVVYSGNKEDTE